MTPVRFGIIGTNFVSDWLADAVSAVDCATVSAVYSRTAEKGTAFAAAHNIPAVYTDMEEFLSSDIDAVYIASPNMLHMEHTLKAAFHGKHVLCEKPMAITLEECERMLSEARRNGKTLAIAHNQRLHPVHRKAKALLEQGVIGAPLRFQTCFAHSGPDHWSVDKGTGNWFFDRSKSAFGAIADLGIHKLDLMRYLLDSDMAEVRAMLGTLDKRDAEGNPVCVDDNALVLCRMNNGMMGTVESSWTCYGPEENDTAIYGTLGTMHISFDAQTLTVRSQNGEITSVRVAPQANTGVIDAFVASIQRGEPSVIDAERVLPSMKALFAALESAHKGVCVHIGK